MMNAYGYAMEIPPYYREGSTLIINGASAGITADEVYDEFFNFGQIRDIRVEPTGIIIEFFSLHGAVRAERYAESTIGPALPARPGPVMGSLMGGPVLSTATPPWSMQMGGRPRIVSAGDVAGPGRSMARPGSHIPSIQIMAGGDGSRVVSSSPTVSNGHGLAERESTESDKLNAGGVGYTLEIKPCTMCQKRTSFTCGRCGAFYCSRECQTQDWPAHKTQCNNNLPPLNFAGKKHVTEIDVVQYDAAPSNLPGGIPGSQISSSDQATRSPQQGSPNERGDRNSPRQQGDQRSSRDAMQSSNQGGRNERFAGRDQSDRPTQSSNRPDGKDHRGSYDRSDGCGRRNDRPPQSGENRSNQQNERSGFGDRQNDRSGFSGRQNDRPGFSGRQNDRQNDRPGFNNRQNDRPGFVGRQNDRSNDSQGFGDRQNNRGSGNRLDDREGSNRGQNNVNGKQNASRENSANATNNLLSAGNENAAVQNSSNAETTNPVAEQNASPSSSTVMARKLPSLLEKLKISPSVGSAAVTSPEATSNVEAARFNKPPYIDIAVGGLVIVTHIENATVYVSSRSENHMDQLLKVLADLQKYSETATPLQNPPKKREFLAAKFSADGKYYRAVAERRVDKVDKKFEVQFVEFGNSEVVTLDSMIPLSDELASVPCMAVPISLLNVPQELFSLPPVAAKMSEYLVKETLLSVEYTGAITDGVILKEPDGSSVNAKLASAGAPAPAPAPAPVAVPAPAPAPAPVAVPAPAPAPAPVAVPVPAPAPAPVAVPAPAPAPAPLAVPAPAPVAAPAPAPLVKLTMDKLSYVPFPDVGKTCTVMINTVLDGGVLMACPADPEAIASVESLLPTLQEFEAGEPYCPEENELCVAKWTEDGMWYRAAVISVHPNDTYEVMFLEYGNVDRVKSSNIRRFTEEIMKVPALSSVCILHGLELKPAQVDKLKSVGTNAVALATVKIKSEDGLIELDIPELVSLL